MKGLILKDIYMMMKYCRAYLLIIVIFTAVSFVDNGNLFLVFYPTILCGMIPVNLLSYDERSRWLQYSGTMPYTKAQIVSSKYLIGLGTQTLMIIITGTAQAIKMSLDGTFAPGGYAVFMLLLLVVSLFAGAITLPFIFKLGVEKGRMAYYIMIGIILGGSVALSGLFNGAMQTVIKMNAILPTICIVGILIYVFSWRLSISFYKKREI